MSMEAAAIEAKKRKLEENGGNGIVVVPVQTPTTPTTGSATNASNATASGAPSTAAAMAAGSAEAMAAGASFGMACVEPPPESNGAGIPNYLTHEDVRHMVELLPKEDLVQILAEATLRHGDVLEEVRKLADRDPAHRKIFVRGLGWDTNTASLRNTFSEYGELEEAIAIMDKNTGKSRGYGFVTYKHIDGAINALKEPSKRIDGRISVCQLASLGPGSSHPPQDLAARKIYVGNVPMDWPVDHLLSIFSLYGEIEEGPLGLDKQIGKARGYALFIYKTADAAKRVLEEPVKNIGGHQLFCKLAIDGSKQRANMHGQPDMGDLGMNSAGGGSAQVSNMGYGGHQYSAGPQGMVSQGVPYGQSPDPSGMNPNMNPNLHPSQMQSRPMGSNPSMAPSMNPQPQVGTPMSSMAAAGPYGAHGGVIDPYNQQVSSAYSGTQGSYAVGAPISAYNQVSGSMAASQPPVMQGQSQYAMSSFQSQQSLPVSYQNQQQQMTMAYQNQQQVTQSSAPRVQSAAAVPYYGM